MTSALQVAGGIGAAVAATTAILAADRRLRAAAMLAAGLLAATLVAGEAWGDQLRSLRDSPLELAAALVAGVAGVSVLAAAFWRYPTLLPVLLLATPAFRIPIAAGGESSNLLVPLYLVLGAGVVVECARAWREPASPGPGRVAPRLGHRGVKALALALSASLVLYAVQSAYSSDVSRAVQNLSFFLVPFALMFVLLRDTDWTPRLLRVVGAVVVAEAVVFATVGIVQHETGHIFWNEKVMESNEFDFYFRVNSLFWDPNIYGRYLALAATVLAGALVWIADRRWLTAGAAAATLIVAGMSFSFSQTSLLALLIGLVVLCALRWSLRWTLIGTGAAIVLVGLVFTLTDALTVGSQSGGELEQTTSGRSRLASGGAELAKLRPLAGFGSGSFAVEFEKRNSVPTGEAVVSHTEPITVAAEQGAIGIAVYVALLAAAATVAAGGLGAVAPGLGGRPPPVRGPGSRQRTAAIARIALAAAFVGLLIHTMGYAGFLIDPLTWALLAIIVALSPGAAES